jgi:hypothetical protein
MLVSLQALLQLFCSVCSDQVVCSGLSLFGSKESFIPVVICHRGLWYVNLPVLATSSFAVSHLNKCRHLIFFCYLVSCLFAGSLCSARCVNVCFGLFLPVRVGSKTSCSWD